MCGIFGVVGKLPIPALTESWVKKSYQLLEKRGPDARGYTEVNNCILGSCRLRVHDVSAAADQPFHSQCGKYTIVFNGAIYNFRELREELKHLGASFYTSSDTEVILQAIIRWREKAFEKLDGMFAIAFLDRLNSTLILGRDRFGTKPLYYYIDDTRMVFSSEIKPILSFPGVPRNVNKDFLPEQVAFQTLAPPNTLFKDVYVLQPGTWWDIDLHDIANRKISYFWQIDGSFLEPAPVGQLEDIMTNAVARCWDNDRNTSIHLSGGVDSSLIVAISRELLGRNEIVTHSVVFDDRNNTYSPDRSEESFIRLVNKKFSCQGNLSLFDDASISQGLSEAIWRNEQPVYSANAVLYYLHAREISKTTTVILSGEGADDIFLGYFDNKEIGEDISSMSSQYLQDSLIHSLFGKDGVAHAFDSRRKIAQSDRLNGFTAAQKTSTLDVEVILHGLLARQDRMFMSHSIEGRPTYCSGDLVKLRFATPDRFVHRNRIGKLIIREMAKGFFGEDFAYRKKRWLSGPTSDWCSSPSVWRPYIEKIDIDVIAEYVNPDPLNAVLCMDDSLEKWSGENLALIFTALNFDIWHKMYIE